MFTRLMAGLGVALLVACSTWSRTPLPELAEAGPVIGQHVRITMRTGESVEWNHVRLKRDSLIGMQTRGSARAAVAVSDVRRVDVLTFSWARTGGLIVGVLLVSTAITMVAMTGAIVSGW